MERPVVQYADSDGLETVADWDCVPGCPVRLLAEQSGERPTGGGRKRKAGSRINPSGWVEVNRTEAHWEASTGTAARFFYQAKSSPTERHAGLDNFYWRRDKESPIGFTRITREEWETLGKRQRATGNIHPTVKSLGIIEYIAKLIMPPENRNLVVPFSGSGSEMIGALRAGWNLVTGIDIIEDYNDIAEARLEHWMKENKQLELGI